MKVMSLQSEVPQAERGKSNQAESGRVRPRGSKPQQTTVGQTGQNCGWRRGLLAPKFYFSADAGPDPSSLLTPNYWLIDFFIFHTHFACTKPMSTNSTL